MDKSIDRMIYGDDYVDKAEKINEGLQLIEQKHLDWFKAKKSRFEKEYAEIGEFIFATYNPSLGLKLSVSEDLPTNINAEVISLYDSVYTRR